MHYPELEGEYQILANFAGDESYGSSGASTAIVVGAEQSTPQTPTTTNVVMPPFELYTIGAAVAIIIAIALATLLILRKR